MSDTTWTPEQMWRIADGFDKSASYWEKVHHDLSEAGRDRTVAAMLRQGAADRERVAALEAELKTTDELLAQRQGVLDAIPECPVHGACVPHALKWIELAKGSQAQLAAITAERDALKAAWGQS